MVQQVHNLVEFQQVLKDAGGKLVVVDFTATWCGPCRKISPVFEQLSKEPANQHVVFVKVDVDEASDVSENCGISCMPTFQFYKNGQKVHEFTDPDAKKLRDKLHELK